MTKRKVVITGLGVIAANGISKTKFWEANVRGESGVDRIASFDASQYQTKIAAEVKDFNPADFMAELTARHCDRFSQFAIGCAKMAKDDSALKLDEQDPERIGVVMGSGLGGMFFYEKQLLVIQEKGPSRCNPRSVPRIMPNAPAAEVAIELKLKGPNLAVAAACASGNHALGQAFELIRRNKADIMFSGGTESPIIPYTFAAFDTLRVMSRRNDSPREASRPFDKERDGFVMGEGAAVLVLEELQHALKRNAPIYAEIIGYGLNSGAYHMVIPAPEGEDAARTMALALKDAGIKPRDVDYINAHGTSTSLNDKTETQAIKKVFGEYAHKIPVSSTKSMIGHAVGAAGAIEAAVCCLTIQNNVIAPTINYKNPDPDCDLDYVPNQARTQKVNVALSNSFGFGSNNATLIFRRYQ